MQQHGWPLRALCTSWNRLVTARGGGGEGEMGKGVQEVQRHKLPDINVLGV